MINEANHFQIFRNVGIEPVEYPYYDPKTIGLDYTGFLNALKTAPERSVFLLHACAHNPTGVDPTQEQWKAIAEVMLERRHYTFFDCAYQGFATGNLDQDAWAVRYFVARGVPLLICQVRPHRSYCQSVCIHLVTSILEFCEECRSIWGTSGGSSCGFPKYGDSRASEKSAFCIAEE